VQRNRKQIAEQYCLALKALDIDASPLSADATDEEVTAVFIRRVSTLMAMALTDLYLVDSEMRNDLPSEVLIAEFARKVPTAFEQQVLTGSGTPVERLLEAMLSAARWQLSRVPWDGSWSAWSSSWGLR
jgi:hypothetical protein